METISFAHPELLWLLILALLPLWRWQHATQTYPAITLIPSDSVSTWLDWGIRLLFALLLAALVVGMAEPFQGGQNITKTGSGAHVVVLLDRSSSMNDRMNNHWHHQSKTYKGSKNLIARQVLGQLIDDSDNDFYGLVSFSTSALYMLPLSQDKAVIRAGINSTLNRGRGSTAVHLGLELALSYFAEQPRTGSRVILLVSDGGGMIPIETQSRLRQQFQDYGVSIYWLYLKSKHGNKLMLPASELDRDTNPEHFLHQFFTTLPVLYQAYEVEEADALDNAIADINQLKNQPLQYQEILPRHDLAIYCYVLALLLLLILIPVRWLEVNSW